MLESIVVAVITGTFSLLAVIAENRRTLAKTQAEFDKTLAVMKEKMTELTREVREHNNFARRMPVVEEQIKQLNNRVQVLEVKK